MVIRFSLVSTANSSLSLTLGLVEPLVCSFQQCFACTAVLGSKGDPHADCKFNAVFIQGD